MFWFFLTKGQTAFVKSPSSDPRSVVSDATPSLSTEGLSAEDAQAIRALQTQLRAEKARAEKTRAQAQARAREKALQGKVTAPAGLEVEQQKRRIEQMIAAQFQGIQQENKRLAQQLAQKDQEISVVKQQNTALAKRVIKLDSSTQTLLAQLVKDGKNISSSDQDYLGGLQDLQDESAIPRPPASDTDLINRVEVADSGDTGTVDAELRSLVGELMAPENQGTIPAASGSQENVVVSAGDAPSSQEGDLQNSINALMARNEKQEKQNQFDTDANYLESLTPMERERRNETRWVTVREGDTLYEIAKRVYNNGDLYYKIFKANPQVLDNPDRIHTGQRLRVPL